MAASLASKSAAAQGSPGTALSSSALAYTISAKERTVVKPSIGITTFVNKQPRADYTSVQESYVYSVAAGGGLPFVLPAIRDNADYGAYLDSLDGLLFSGGGDVSPLRYGESLSPKVSDISFERDEWEIGLCLAAYERRMPILGICRGHQLVNVALGGSLIQDIPSEMPAARSHSSDMRPEELSHYVDIEEADSRLYSALGKAFGSARILTNSFHHQAVKVLAPGLAPTARTEDGVNEGYESPDKDRFLVCVQFHPECLTRGHPEFVALFSAFAEAARGYRASRPGNCPSRTAAFKS
jgi:putative glutamine amidotransferase